MDKLKQIYEAAAEKTTKETNYPPEELVFGQGSRESDIVLIGEAPGATEVEERRPFAGKAGKNLDEFLEITGIERASLFITNVVKLRPFREKNGRRSNRPPTAKEIAVFSDCLEAELDYLSPKLIVTLGNTALRAMLKDKRAVIGEYHGRLTNAGRGRLVFALYHPASVIYNRALRDIYIEDLKKLREVVRQL